VVAQAIQHRDTPGPCESSRGYNVAQVRDDQNGTETDGLADDSDYRPAYPDSPHTGTREAVISILRTASEILDSENGVMTLPRLLTPMLNI
jgi:hypothetical protein